MTTKFLIKINYKSGKTHSFWCYNFNVNHNEITWTSCDDNNKPLKINFGEIESIWQIGYKNKIFGLFWW